MNDQSIVLPLNYKSIKKASEVINFNMPSDLQTGSLLRTLITSKPNGKFLELGTGTGLSLSWIVEAMDNSSEVISVDSNENFISIAKDHFDSDKRVSIVCADGNQWIKDNQDKSFDLIFADAWPGKYEAFDETLALLIKGGFYIIDDMLSQPNWPTGHEDNVLKLVRYIENLPGINLTKMNWSTGLIIVTKK